MKLFKNILTVGIMRVILTVLIFISDIIVSRYLGVEAKGEYFLLITLILTCGNLFTGGLHLGNVYYSKDRSISQLAMNSFLYLAGLGIFLFGIGLPLLVHLHFLDQFAPWVRIVFLACLFFESAWIIFTYFFVAMDNLYQYSQAPILRRLLFLILVSLAFIFYQFFLPLILVAYLLSSICSLLFMIIKFPWQQAEMKWRMVTLWQSCKYGLRSQALVMADDFTLRINVIFLGIWANPIENGFYSVALNIGQGFPVLAFTLGTVIQSAVTYTFEEQLLQFEKLFRHVLPVMVASGLILAMGAGPLIHFAYGLQFSGSVKLLQLIIPGMICFALYMLIGRFLLTNGRPGTGFICSISGLIVNIIMAYLLIPYYGAVGAIMSLQAGYLTSALLFTIIICNLYKIKLSGMLFLNKEDIINISNYFKKFISIKS